MRGLTKKVVLQQTSKNELRRWKRRGVQGYLVQCRACNLEIAEEGQMQQISVEYEKQELTAII